MRTYFERAIKQIKDLGFKVYIPNDPERKYGWIVEGNNIGHFYEGDFGGIFFTTVHKPCTSAGTGYSVSGDAWHGLTIDEITAEEVRKSFAVYPSWVKELVPIKKYKNWEEYLEKYWDKKNIIEA